MAKVILQYCGMWLSVEGRDELVERQCAAFLGHVERTDALALDDREETKETETAEAQLEPMVSVKVLRRAEAVEHTANMVMEVLTDCPAAFWEDVLTAVMKAVGVTNEVMNAVNAARADTAETPAAAMDTAEAATTEENVTEGAEG